MTEFSRKQTERLARRFAHVIWDDVSISEYKRVIGGMAELYGEADTQLAVTRMIDSEGFLDPAKLQGCVPPKQMRHEYCPQCRDAEGWLAIMADGEKMPRRIRCKHEPLAPTLRVKIGPHEVMHRQGEECHCSSRKSVTAICCDYVDAQ